MHCRVACSVVDLQRDLRILTSFASARQFSALRTAQSNRFSRRHTTEKQQTPSRSLARAYEFRLGTDPLVALRASDSPPQGSHTLAPPAYYEIATAQAIPLHPFAQAIPLHPFARTITTDMAAYTTPTGNYPPPHGPPHPSHPGIPLSAHSPGGAQNDPLNAHHGLHVAQPYQYDPQPSQQSPYNHSPNAATNAHADADSIQYQPAQYQGPPVPAPTTGDVQKANRLRKACDSCSVRKVKVSRPT
jgi:hypothetical protein